jgi:hypothetical protein
LNPISVLMSPCSSFSPLYAKVYKFGIQEMMTHYIYSNDLYQYMAKV